MPSSNIALHPAPSEDYRLSSPDGTAVGHTPDGTAVGHTPDGTAVGHTPDGTAVGHHFTRSSSDFREPPRVSGMFGSMRFFDPDRATTVRHGNLPHWRQDGVVYFVTFRTIDSLPTERREKWTVERADWLARNPPPRTVDQRREYWERFPNRVQRWLDQGHGACVFRDPTIAEIVEDALRHFDGDRYRLDEHVVAPNHVHVLVETASGSDLSSILRSWKSHSARLINRRIGRRGAFWQRESFDHIVRSARSLERFRGYIRAHDEPATT